MKHLGRNTTQYHYNDIDSSLLERVERMGSYIEGVDVWHGYEFSTLNRNGLPINGILKITIPTSSKYIVESKSLKLYLNTFNNVKIGSLDREPFKMAETKITEALRSLLECDKIICRVYKDNLYNYVTDACDLFSNLMDHCSPEIEIGNYQKNDSSLLSVRKNDVYYIQKYKTDVLKSNCKVTGQPDWADVFIYYNSLYQVDPESLMRYLVSFRNVNHFHEECTSIIYNDLFSALQPIDLAVCCKYTRRGGIDINPVRVSSSNLAYAFFGALCENKFLTDKTFRQ